MNKIWLFVVCFSLAVLLFCSPNSVLGAMSLGANNAVRLSLELAAVYALWSGILKILEKTGISNLICKLLSPVVDFLFGKTMTQEAKQFVTLNMTANILGMGGAATPMGIKAIEAMDDKKPYATTQMIMLVVLSATSLQLIPTSVVGLFAQKGANNASSIVLPSIIASTASTLTGVLGVKILSRLSSKKAKRKNL